MGELRSSILLRRLRTCGEVGMNAAVEKARTCENHYGASHYIAVQILTTQATFECPICHEMARTEVQVPEPDWGAAESFSDLTSEDDTTVTCNHCSTEFPAYVMNNGSSCEITLDGHPDARVHADPPFFTPPDEDDGWLNHEIPRILQRFSWGHFSKFATSLPNTASTAGGCSNTVAR